MRWNSLKMELQQRQWVTEKTSTKIFSSFGARDDATEELANIQRELCRCVKLAR